MKNILAINSSMFTIFLICLIIYPSYFQSIPQIQPVNSTVGAQTSYMLNYFSSKQIKTTTKFTVDFTSSNIDITNGNIGCVIKLNNVQVSTPSCNCSVNENNKICEMKPNSYANYNTKVEIIFDGLTNPFYLSTEYLPVDIYFSPSISSESYSVTVLNIFYQPMNIKLNSFIQSQYGVGSTPVSYTFNLSMYYISQNFQMQIQIPQEVSYKTITSQISFYGTVQDINMMQIQSLLIFNIQTPTIKDPTGYMLLTLHGFGNPQFIGNSSSFRIIFQQTTAVSNCATCKIAQKTTGLVVQSKTPGDISILSFTSSDLYIASKTNISINLQLYAGIPIGGKVSVYLPEEITPVVPINCLNVYGFVITDGNQPHCTYDESQNRIDTQNFAFPFLVSIGNGILSLELKNPIDTRKVQFHFETFDSSGRTIGKSRQQYYYSAIPLIMTASATKNNTQVDSAFTLSTQITLQRQISSTQNKIQVIFPTGVNYDLNKISCLSAQQDLGCKASLDNFGQLIVEMTPPCVSCAQGNNIKFTINNLKNPSYISQQTQAIYIHTKSLQGNIEASQTTISLEAAPINLINYNIPSGQFVGSSYDLTITLMIPEYIIDNGGKIHLIFQQNRVYCDPKIDQNTGVFQSLDDSLNVLSGTSQVPNQLQYYSTYEPASINRIILDICNPLSAKPCVSGSQQTFVIKQLKQGYIPSIQNVQTLKITTVLNQLIAEKQIDMSSKSPIMKTGSLEINMDPDMTNILTKYTIKFTSNEIVFSDKINFQFSPDQQIKSSHCQFDSNYLVGINYACSNVSTTKIQIDHDLSQTLMISNQIQYSIVINSVESPKSTQPRTYKLATYYNGTKNQQFTATVSAKNPYPLQIEFTKNNDTIGQPCLLSFEITPKTLFYDSFSLFIMKSMLLISKNDAQNMGYTFNQNSTYYNLSQNNKIANNQTSIEAQNVFSTGSTGSVTIITYKSNFQVERKTLTLPNTEPLTLGLTLESTNRTVGQLTNITIRIDRNNDGGFGETELLVQLPTNGFSYDSSSYQAEGIDSSSPKISIPINISSPRIIQIEVKNLRNILYVPNLDQNGDASDISDIKVFTKKSVTEIVGSSSIKSSSFVSNEPAFTKSIVTRSQDKSGQSTNITINYTTKFGTNVDKLQIYLPQGQNTYVSTSSCLIANQPCYIYQSNLTYISMQYIPNSIIILENVLNYHPNTNTISFKLKNSNNQTIQQSQVMVAPPIALQYLHVQSIASSSVVGENNIFQFTITSTDLPIQPNHFMMIEMPENTFTRKLTTKDCQIIVHGNTYTGCQYIYDGMWLKNIKISSFGPLVINSKVAFALKLYVTNPWATNPFSSKAIKFIVYKNETTALSEGTQTLAEIYSSLSGFSPIQISSNEALQTNLNASEDNNITLNIKFNGNLYREGSWIHIMVPKDTYTGLIEESSQLPTIYSRFYKQDQMYFHIKSQLDTSVCSLQICTNYTALIVLSVKNNQFIKLQRNNIIAFAQYNELASSQFYSQKLQEYQALQPNNYELNRSNNLAGSDSIITIQFQTANHQTIIIQFNKDILHDIQNISCIQGVNNLNCITDIKEEYIHITLNSYNSNQNIVLKVEGQNTLQVPKVGLELDLTIRNQTYLLYQQQNKKFNQALTPITQGLSLSRSNPVVSEETHIFLLGDLQNALNYVNISKYNVFVNNVNYGSPSSYSINIMLNNYTNPLTIQKVQNFECEISNSTHIVYKNSSTNIHPKLQPITVHSSDISITVADQIYVNTLTNISVNFGAQQKMSTIDIITPVFYSNLIQVVGYFHQTQISLLGSVTQINETYERITVSKSNKLFTITDIIITVKTNIYQTIIQNQNIQLVWQSPSKYYASEFNIQVYGSQMTAYVTPGSYRTRNITNYQIDIQTIAREGQILVILPQYLSSLIQLNNIQNKIVISVDQNVLQLNNTDGYTVSQNQNNQYQLSISIPSTGSVTKVTINSIANPDSNKPIQFIILQTQKQNISQIYGYKKVAIKMKQLDPIFVYQAHRNTTKIGENIELVINIETPGYQDDMIIQLPITQVIVDQSFCYVQIDGIEKNCVALQDNKIKMLNEPGNHTYLIKSLRNSEFSQKPTEQDKVKIYIGLQYQKAQTTFDKSVFVTPLVVTGELKLSSVHSTNQNRAQYTTLSFNLQPENWQISDGIVIAFSDYAYYVHTQMSCFINNKQVSYMMINRSSLYIESKSHRSDKMYIKIEKLINYFENGPYKIYTVKNRQDQVSSRRLLNSKTGIYSQQLFGIMDYLQISSPKIVLKAGAPATRIILPHNYVSSDKKIIIALNDADLPKQLPTDDLYYNFGSQFERCIQNNLQFNQTLSIQCVIKYSGKADFYVQLYNSKHSSAPLTRYTETINIYEQPSSDCSNQMCDLCSSSGSGQYCFVCREGLISNNGQCVQECNQGNFDYEGVCTECSPKCQSCFDFYHNSCLSCKDSLLLDSGLCVNQCSKQDHFDYLGFCVNEKQCQNQQAQGCRICSDTGFCYQCLPNYDGEPNCQYHQILPPAFFIFFMIPFILLFVAVTSVTCYKNGFETYPNLFIYLISVVQLFSWIFTVPRLPEQPLSMVLLSFILLRIINAILAYELVYRKMIINRKESRLLKNQEQNNNRQRQSGSQPETEHPQRKKSKEKISENSENVHDPETVSIKQKICRFSAHFLSCDAYQLLMSKIGNPYITLEHHNIFQILNILNRTIIMGILVYTITNADVIDLLIVPLIGIICGGLIITARVVQSNCCRNLMIRIRG